jgi:hypothetical protein
MADCCRSDVETRRGKASQPTQCPPYPQPYPSVPACTNLVQCSLCSLCSRQSAVLGHAGTLLLARLKSSPESAKSNPKHYPKSQLKSTTRCIPCSGHQSSYLEHLRAYPVAPTQASRRVSMPHLCSLLGCSSCPKLSSSFQERIYSRRGELGPLCLLRCYWVMG